MKIQNLEKELWDSKRKNEELLKKLFNIGEELKGKLGTIVYETLKNN